MAFFAGGHVPPAVGPMTLGCAPCGPLEENGLQLLLSRLAVLLDSKMWQQNC